MKSKRHSAIIDIIKNNDIETQEELADRLKAMGFDVTQATVSRDIRQLKLTKIQYDNNKQKYAAISGPEHVITERQIRVFKEGVASMQVAGNILVIKTLVGMAMAVAAALDAMDNKEIIGTIAGDDTIFSVFKNVGEAEAVLERLHKFTGV
jgi:transcriptional regulator of arginine metabolism